MEVYGIERGYAGLLNEELYKMEMRSVSNIVQCGGTKLRTARCLEMLTEEGQQKAVATIKKYGLEGLVVIGGDGSFRGAKILSEKYGIPTIGIPGTIDNDLEYTDYTLGFDTAVNTCLDIINKLRDTMTSHERISVVEVMGRHCGDIALYSGIASGAEIIVVPEIPFDINEIVTRINRSRASGKHSNIIVIAEGVMGADAFAKQLQERTPYDVRPTCIGHVQRGGSPSMADRMLAAQFGNKAVRLLNEGIGNRVVGIRDNKIIDMDIIEAVSMKKTFNYELYETLQMISM
jgi:6-phosphofructokinase 1